MRPPQGHNKGSASKIFLTNGAHVLRASLEQFELSRSGAGAGQPMVIGWARKDMAGSKPPAAGRPQQI
jgi:hypothetical protein